MRVSTIHIKIQRPVNQDATSVVITRYDGEGRQYYAKSFEWVEYEGFEVLDISDITFPATDVRIID